VVSNAGILKDSLMLKMSEEAFDDVIRVNLKGTFNVNQIFAREMKLQKVKDGSIINMASLVGNYSN
jgi:NAD(P)-dependent dehydrogenase (short-subunit alcohol dehydrogenase family)